MSGIRRETGHKGGGRTGIVDEVNKLKAKSSYSCSVRWYDTVTNGKTGSRRRK